MLLGCMLKIHWKNVGLINIIYMKINKVYEFKQELYSIKPVKLLFNVYTNILLLSDIVFKKTQTK